MATKTAGIRIDEEQFDKFNEIKDNFPKASDFANWIISAYSKYESEHTEDLFASEIEAISSTLESLMHGINRISTLSADIVHNKEVQVKSTIEEQQVCLNEHKAEIEQLKQSALSKEEHYMNCLSEKDKELKIAKDAIKHLEEQLYNNTSELSKAQKDIEMLIRLNSLLEKDKNEYEKTLSDNQELRQELTEYKDRLAATEKSLFEANNQLKEIHHKNESIIAEHKKELELKEKMHELAVSQATVNATTKFQEQIELHLAKEDELRRQIDILKEENVLLSKSN